MPEPTLHPNLAKIASAYDEIIERLQRRALTPQAARELIAQLEARDDDGVRWSIDPDTGQWCRRTAFGDAEFDTAPPTFGYVTFDAHSLGGSPATFNPSDRLTYQVATQPEPHPGALLGATRRRQSVLPARAGMLQRVVALPTRAKVALVLLALALLSFLAHTALTSAPADAPAGHVQVLPGS